MEEIKSIPRVSNEILDVKEMNELRLKDKRIWDGESI